MSKPAPIAPLLDAALPEAGAPELQRAVAVLEDMAARVGARFSSRMFRLELQEIFRRELQRAASPLCDRAGAAALALCSVDQIDAAAKAGIIQRYPRGETPLFDKAEIIEAIKGGKWKFPKKKQPLMDTDETQISQYRAGMTKSEDRGGSRKDGTSPIL